MVIALLQQRADLSLVTLNAGDVLTLRGVVRSSGAPNFRLRIVVTYSDSTVQLAQARYNAVNATYIALVDPISNQPLALTLTRGDVVQVRVVIWSRNSTGRTYCDDLSLIATEASLQPLIPSP